MPLSLSLSSLSSSSWRGLPTTPGVYIYKDATGKVIYVGKAKNLKSRVRSYFQPPERLGPKTQILVSQIASIDHINVNSEVEALLLESHLIKKFYPPFNIVSKDDTSPYYIHFSKDIWPKPIINHDPKKSLAGPFLNSLVPKRILAGLRNISPYCSDTRPVRRPCLYYHLGLCSPCPGLCDQSLLPDYVNNIKRLKILLRGQFNRVKSQLKKEINILSRQLKYEQAAKLADQLSAFKYLENQPVLPEEYLTNPNLVEDIRNEALNELYQALVPPLNIRGGQGVIHRIEMFDIAHLSGIMSTAAMSVAVDGEINSREFKHFKIKSAKTDSDVDMMREVLTRRLSRKDWPRPDLIALDGGKAQLRVLRSLGEVGSIPFIALAKQFETIVMPVGNEYKEINLPKDNKGLLLLMHLRDEAHRFSRRLHHHYRSKSFLTNMVKKP